jgi:hypothetical protein
LPEPDGPSTARHSPSATEKESGGSEPILRCSTRSKRSLDRQLEEGGALRQPAQESPNPTREDPGEVGDKYTMKRCLGRLGAPGALARSYPGDTGSNAIFCAPGSARQSGVADRLEKSALVERLHHVGVCARSESARDIGRIVFARGVDDERAVSMPGEAQR